MGIFNRSIPTYTVDTANKIRITKPLPQEEPNTYIDDAFDPILNKAVRDRLIRQWGNPISATLAGYHEMLNNALVGSTKQWGPLGPGMGVLGSFGRTMDKGGDLIIGGLTEGIKGVTGQGIESPFYNIFTKDEDYTGGKLLAAMGNSMAKLANAPELTEEDFGGAWKIPSIGLELATDPGILGGTLAKAGGAVGKRSTSEILQNLGKVNNSVLSDVGQLLSNYDDAMTKIALDVTAPGTRVAIGKAWDKLDQLFQTSSAKNLQNVDLDFNAPPEAKIAAFDEYQHDPTAQTVVHMASNLEKAEETAKLKKHYAKFANSLPLAEREKFIEAYKTLQDYFGVDEPLSHIDELRENYNRFEELFSEYTNYRDMFDTPDVYSEMLYKRVMSEMPSEYLNARNKLLDFKHHHYGKTRKAYDDVKAILRKTSEARKKATDELKPIEAMSVKDIPDAILELENIAYKAPENLLAIEKPSTDPKNFTPEFVNVLRKMPGGDLKKFLKRIKVSMEDYKARVSEIDADTSKLLNIKTNFDTAVQTQRGRIKNLISEKFKYLPSLPDYELMSEELDELTEAFEHELLQTRMTDNVHPLVKALQPYFRKLTGDRTYEQFMKRTPIRNSNHKLFKHIANTTDPDVKYVVSNLYSQDYDPPFSTVKTSFEPKIPIQYDIPKVVTPTEPLPNIAPIATSEYDDSVLNDIRVLRWLKKHGASQETLKLGSHPTPRESQALAIYHEPSSKQRTKLRRKYSMSPAECEGLVEDFENRLSILKRFEKDFKFSKFNTPSFLQGDAVDFAEFNERLKDSDLTLQPKKLKRSDAPFTISVSEHRLVNDPNISKNAVRYVENSLMNRLKHYGYPKKGVKKDFWSLVNSNPILRQAFITEYDYSNITEDLSKMFKAKTGRDLNINFNDPNIKQYVLKFLTNHPEITSISKGDRIYIEGLHDAIFGKWDSKAKGYTYQNQFVALDQFTRDLESSLSPIVRSDNASEPFITAVLDNISTLDDEGKVIIDPIKASKPQSWYTKQLHTQIRRRLDDYHRYTLNKAYRDSLGTWMDALPDEYEDAVTLIKNIGMKALGGDEVEMLYQWAKQMQDEVFLPAKNLERKSVFDYVDFNGETIVEDTVSAFDTKTLNNAIRSNLSEFKSIGDVKNFAKGFDVGFELKFKNLTNLTLEGSRIDEAIADLITKYPKNEFVTEIVEDSDYALKRFVCDTHVEPYTDKFGKLKSKTVYTLNEDLYKVLVDIVSSKSNTSLGAIINRAPESVKDILPDKLASLLTSIDLAPTFVKPTVIKSKKTLIDAFYVKPDDVSKTSKSSEALKASEPSKITDEAVANVDNTVKQEMSELPPSVNAEIVAEPPTSVDAAKQADLQAVGVEDVAEDAKRISEEVGGSPEDLPPEGREKLILLYGKDKVDLFDVVNKSFVSHAHAKYDKTVPLTEIETGRKLSKTAETLSSNPKAADNLRMYDAISTAEHGDSIAASKMLDEIVSSGGYVGIRFDNSETKAIETLRAQLKKYTEYVNNTVGTSVLKVYDTTDKSGTYIRVALDVSNSKKIIKAKFDKLKFANDDFITFEAPRALTAEELTFKESSEYAAYDEFAKGMTSYVQGIYKPLGFVYDNPIHIKHVKNDFKAANDIVNMMNSGVDSPALNALAKRLLDSDAFNHMYGTFGTVPFGKGLRGGNWRWNFGKYETFDFEPSRVLNSTFVEGTLSNTDVQNFVGIFMSDNYKVRTFYNTVDDIKKVLYAKGPNGEVSGNMANLDIIAPVYDANGKVIKFRRFDKTTGSGLAAALADENAVLVPSSLVASLDVWCKKNAKMSSKIYRFFNKMFGLPYKIGVLANPGFILGNVGDAYLKQATTMHMKYGTSMAEELVNVTDNIKDIIVLNNKATDVFDKYLEFCKNHEVKLPPSEQLLHSLNLNSKARRKFVDFLNGKMVVKGSEVPVTSVLSPNEVDSMRLWLYLNNAQPSTISKNSVRDFSKDEIDTTTNNFIERIFYGKGKFDYKNPKTWGAVRNPGTEGTFYVSEMWEAVVRSAEILNDLKHTGYDTNALTKILSSGADPEVAKKLHVDTVNAINTMFNSNFNYEAQSNLMDKIGYAVPFPTFFLKNFTYWMKLLVENPEYVDSAITIQEGLWSDRKDDVEEDVFMAEAKGRGAVPINNGDERGLSKFFRGVYKPTPLNSMFSAFNLLNHPIENLTTRVHPLINTPMQLVQGKLGEHEVGLATYSDAENVKYRPYSMNRFERNRNITDDNFNPVSFAAHKLNPYDRTIGNALRFPDKMSDGDVQLSDIVPSVFQPDF